MARTGRVQLVYVGPRLRQGALNPGRIFKSDSAGEDPLPANIRALIAAFPPFGQLFVRPENLAKARFEIEYRKNSQTRTFYDAVQKWIVDDAKKRAAKRKAESQQAQIQH
jgi:hypothetical protein